MLSRFYLIFAGIVLLVMGIVGYMSPNFLTGDPLSATTPTIWLITGLVALIVAFFVKSVPAIRWTSGIIGLIYLAWGLIGLFGETAEVRTNTLGLLLISLGALGLAAALAPAYWMRERETYAPSQA